METSLRTVLHVGFDEAVSRITEALKSEGFGVLTDVDVQRTLEQKLGAQLRKYRILGACNPPFAHAALQLNPDAGLMMPCNVAVYEGDRGEIIAVAVDPSTSVSSFGDPRLEDLARDVRERLGRVIAKLS